MAPRLNIPPHFKVPESTRNLGKLRAAYSGYAEHPEWWNPVPVSEEDFILVCKYMDMYPRDLVSLFLLPPGRQGVSLIEHELAELECYIGEGRDPYDREAEDQERDLELYKIAHPRGLIAEHRYLQECAAAAGASFRLGELILWNPVARDPELDLQYVLDYVEAYGAGAVSEEELVVRVEKKKDVYDWYRSQQFQGDYPEDLA